MAEIRALPSQEIKFDNNRSKLVLEIGHGGGASISMHEVADYLKTKDANYLGIDPHPSASEGFEMVRRHRKADWALNIRGEVQSFDLPQVDEIWMANFKHLESEDSHNLAVCDQIGNLLKPGGKAFIFNYYDSIPKEDEERIKSRFKQSGLEVEDVDLATYDHPLLNGMKRINRVDIGIDSVLDDFTSEEDLYAGKMAFVVTKK